MTAPWSAGRIALPGPRLAWWAALAALLAAMALALGLTPTWRAQADQAHLQQQQQQQRLQQRHAALRRAGPAAPAMPSDAQRLAGNLPPADTAHQRVADLLAQARAQGLGLHSVRQRWGTAGNGDAASLLPLQLSMQVQGPYRQLRAFVAQALQHDEGLALQALHLDADDGPSPQGSGGLRAELQWTLLMRAPAPAAP